MGAWGLLMGRSWTMLRLGPRQVKVRKGLGTGGLLLPTGTERMDSFTCRAASAVYLPRLIPICERQRGLCHAEILPAWYEGSSTSRLSASLAPAACSTRRRRATSNSNAMRFWCRLSHVYVLGSKRTSCNHQQKQQE